MGKKREPVVDMSYQEFGDYLFVTGDLDPVYIMLANAEQAGVLDESTLKRFLLAYWCYYSCGVAARIAEGPSFYSLMWQGISDRWPRGMERRYFWGDQARNTIVGLQEHGEPEDIVDDMCAHYTFKAVYDKVVSYRGFGPWMGWKVADMAERVLSYPVDFSDSTLGIYKDPRQAAAFIIFGDKHHVITDDELDDLVGVMVGQFDNHLAPPWYDRPPNIQEIETVLCKYKAHCYGAYPLGNDTHHVANGMVGWGDLADELIKFMPEHVGVEEWGNAHGA